MTKKHFIGFANNIKRDVDTANGSQSVARENLLRVAAEKAQMVCAVQDNPNFDKGRFLRACGLGE